MDTGMQRMSMRMVIPKKVSGRTTAKDNEEYAERKQGQRDAAPVPYGGNGMRFTG
jgi:hypothetical protein